MDANILLIVIMVVLGKMTIIWLGQFYHSSLVASGLVLLKIELVQ